MAKRPTPEKQPTHAPAGAATSPIDSASILGPNTNAPTRLLAHSTILCAGEHPAELEQSLNAHLGSAREDFSYRCSRFWTFGDDVSVVWTGMGTACIETLLTEILRPNIIQRLVLIGTAGLMRDESVTARPYLAAPAHSLGTAFDSWLGEEGCQPRIRTIDVSDLPQASIVSTDFYYLCSPAAFDLDSTTIPANFLSQLESHMGSTDLIDMETAQLYMLAERLGGEALTDFVSIKSPSNSVYHQEEQVRTSATALEACLQAALHALGFTESRNVPSGTA